MRKNLKNLNDIKTFIIQKKTMSQEKLDTLIGPQSIKIQDIYNYFEKTDKNN